MLEAVAVTPTAIVAEMRALVLEPDPKWLEERRRLGLDQRDEVWDGVLHVVPPATSFHQRLEGHLLRILAPIVERLGLEILPQSGVFDPARGEANYRVPDLVVAHPDRISERGIEGRCELVVEILSPHDESRDKFSFYARLGVQEVWLADPRTREIEVYVLRGATYFAVAPNRAGAIDAPRLALTLEVIAGPKLRIAWDAGTAEI